MGSVLVFKYFLLFSVRCAAVLTGPPVSGDLVAHDHIGVQPPLIAIAGFKQGFGKRFCCLVGGKQVITVVTSVDNMIPGSRKLNPD